MASSSNTSASGSFKVMFLPIVSTSVPLLDAAVGAPVTEIPSPRNIFILVSLSCYKCIKLILIKRGLKWFSRG